MNEELLIISALLNGVAVNKLAKHNVSSKDFILYKDEMTYIERRGVPSKGFFKKKFPEFRLKKVAPEDFDHIVAEFKTKKARHKLGTDLQTILDKFDTEDPAKIALKLYEVSKGVINKGSKIQVSDIVSEWEPIYKNVQKKAELRAKGISLGIPTGIPTIDKSMNGLMPAELITVLGFQSEGKSWVLSDFASMALYHEKKVLFVSLEMTKERLAYRIHTMISSILSGKRSGTFANLAIETTESLDLEKYERFLRTTSQKYRKGFYVVDNGVSSMAQLAGLVEEYRPDVVFWDYIGLNIGAEKNSQDWQRVGDEAGMAKEVAKEFNIPVVVAAQANRGGSNDRENPPTLANVAKSYLIGAHSDRVISLRSNKNELILELIKNRYGPTVKIICDWDVNFGIIREQSAKIKMPKSLVKDRR